MATCMDGMKGGKHNSDGTVSGKKKRSDIATKRAENKQKLINEILHMISSDMYEYEDLVLNLAESELERWTQKDLKTLL